MARKEFMFRGKKMDELKKLSIKEFAELIPSKERRKIKRGLTDQEKILLKKVERNDRNIETHCREMIILPMMVGKEIKIHRGNEFVPIMIAEDMVVHRLGEFAPSRKTVSHSSPGIGATRSSANLSVK